MPTLVIVESLAKQKTLQHYLGSEYLVKAAGSLFPGWPNNRLGIDTDFSIEFEATGKKKLLKDLIAAHQKCNITLFATDPDREGELLAQQISEMLNVQESLCRLDIFELTMAGIEKGLRNARLLDKNKVLTAKASMAINRLIDYKILPIAGEKTGKVGREALAALRLLCDRKRQRDDFKPKKYWTVLCSFFTYEGEEFVAQLTSECKTKEEADFIAKGLLEREFFVDTIETKKIVKAPQKPFTTCLLYEKACNLLKLCSGDVYLLAKALYEGINLPEGPTGLITYIKTDTSYILPDFQLLTREFLLHDLKLGQYLPKVLATYDKECIGVGAIRPTNLALSPEKVKAFLKPQEFLLYKLIYEHYLASQLNSSIDEVTTIRLKNGTEIFTASVKTNIVKGFTAIENHENSPLLPHLMPKEQVMLSGIDCRECSLESPERFTEAELFTLMKNLKIFRAGTYLLAIEKLVAKGYAEINDGYIEVTEKGLQIDSLLREYFDKIIGVAPITTIEQGLDFIENGETAYRTVLENFHQPFDEAIAAARHNKNKKKSASILKLDEKCPICGGDLVIRLNKTTYDTFIGCTNYPECKYSREQQDDIDEVCPKCGQPIILRKRKRGRSFYGCSGYPACDFTVSTLKELKDYYQ